MTAIVAFTADQVCQLTALSRRQLRYWDKTGFFSPDTVGTASGRIFSRLYSFRDVVGLRVIGELRKRVPLQELRKIGEWLRLHHQSPWSTLRFALNGRRVVFFEEGTGVARDARDGKQAAIEVTLEPIANAVQAETERLAKRREEDLGRVVRNRHVVQNAWALAGTRISTSSVWSFHRAGYEPEAIVREFPRLSLQDVEAAVRFEEQRQAA